MYVNGQASHDFVYLFQKYGGSQSTHALFLYKYGVYYEQEHRFSI